MEALTSSSKKDNNIEEIPKVEGYNTGVYNSLLGTFNFYGGIIKGLEGKQCLEFRGVRYARAQRYEYPTEEKSWDCSD